MADSFTPIEVQQSVLGYEDGHRLLAQSKSTTPADSTLLLVASDLAPGLRNVEDIDYWTGLPLPDEQHYALLRTWPAPEISRPGCVWTHVLRIPFADIARFVDLGSLRQLMRRPTLGGRFEEYRRPIVAVPERAPQRLLSDEARMGTAALALLQCLYRLNDPTPVRWLPGMEDALFSIWSQQWPRLRRHFSFRTAVGSRGSPRELRIHLQIVARSIVDGRSLAGPPADWEQVALSDLFSDQPSELRRFLWRYGSDIRNGIESFSTLIELFNFGRVDPLNAARQSQLLQIVAQAFPSPSDARTLKSDLVATPRSPYSRLPDIDPLGVWEFLIEQSGDEQWPVSPTLRTDVLPAELISRPALVTDIAERALHGRSPAAQEFLSIFTRALSPELFWSRGTANPELLRAVAAARPELLDHPKLIELSPSTLVDLLQHCALSDDLAERVLVRLMRVDERSIAALMWDRYPDVVIHSVIAAPESGIAEVWMKLIEEHSDRWIQPSVLVEAAKERALARIVHCLDPKSPAVLAAGSRPWLDALQSVTQEDDDIWILTFVMIVALQLPQCDSEYLIERAFEPVYRGIKRHRIPYRLFDVLVGTLETVPYWKEWDNCFRLTLTVAKLYVDRNRRPDKLAQGISTRSIRKRLLNIFESIKAGNLGSRDFYNEWFDDS